MAVNGFTNIVTNGLVLNLDAGNLKSYPTSGTTWTDLTKNNNGTLVSAPTFNNLNGGSLVFNGSTQYVDCGNANYLSFERTDSFSFCCWIYPNSFSSTGVLASKYNASDRGLSFLTGVGSLILVLRNTVTTNDFVVQTADNIILINNWYFVTVTYNGSSNATGVTFYINGVSNLNNTIVRNVLTATISNTVNFMVGARTLANNAYFNGRISNFLTYNKLLSPSEVLQNYNATKWRYQ